ESGAVRGYFGKSRQRLLVFWGLVRQPGIATRVVRCSTGNRPRDDSESHVATKLFYLRGRARGLFHRLHYLADEPGVASWKLSLAPLPPTVAQSSVALRITC